MTARKKTNRKSKSSVARKRRLAGKQSGSLNFETLERRELLAAITVSNASDILSLTADTSSITALVASDGGDGISLREAITAANNTTGEDAITFDAGVFTGGDNNLIRLTEGELRVSESLSIDGTSVGGVAITGDANGDDITVADTNITDVEASFGQYVGGPDDLLDDNSRVLNFSASLSNLTLTDLTITGGNTDTGSYGGGGGVRFSGSELTLNQSIVSGNSVRGSRSDGGGITVQFGDIFLLDSSTVSGNYSYGGGGGLHSRNGDVLVDNSSVNGNSANGSGGGIYSFSGEVSLTNSSVNGNNSRSAGAGIRAVNGVLSLNNSTVNGNVLTGSGSSGGGIFSGGGDVFLTDSTVSGNVATSSGGGIYNVTNGLSLTNSTVSGNISSRDGGGIFTRLGEVSLTNSTVTGNSASRVGGGISFRVSSSEPATQLTLHNSIVANNLDDGTAPDIGSVYSGNDLIVESSLIGNTTGSEITFATGIGNILNQLPLLGPLANNGGPTQTHALLSGSPAINLGSNAIANAAGLLVDQRGEDRIQFGTVDIGAFESDLNERSLVVTTNQDVDDPNDGVLSLREAITFFNNGVSDDTITFAPNVFDAQTTINISSQLPTITGALTIVGPGANLLTIDALGGGDNVLDGNGFRIFEINDGDLNNSVDVFISGLTLTGGDNNDFGGAISNFENLSLDGVAVVGNRARFGGGISSDLSGSLTISNSTIANNEASQDGGGVLTGGDFTATTITISGNSAVGSGGAIFTAGGLSGSELNLTQSTLTNNTGVDGVHFDNDDGLTTATFNNTIIDSPITSVGNTNTTLTGNNNLFVSADPGITGTGNLFNQTSMLGLLADNGGSMLTHALLFGSPAINAGNNALAVDENGNPLATDQRGEARILFDTVDIGAVETRFNELRSLVVTTIQDVVNPDDGLTSLREAIVFANTGVSNTGDADGDGLRADTITFDAGVFAGGDSVIRLTQGELQISESLTIDGSSVGGVVITGDAENDDITIAGSHITDVSASFGGTAGASDDLLDDNSRVLNFSAVSGDLTLTGLTVTGGRVTGNFEDGGGIEFISSGTLTLNQSIVSGNSAAGNQADGGGIFSNTGDVLLIDSTVSGNISDRFGGGVGVSFGDVSIIGSTVSENISRGGGGVNADTGDVSLVDSTVNENISQGVGGGIRNLSGDVSLTYSTVSDNSGLGNGGGIYTNSGSSSFVSLVNSTVSGNTSNGSGGGISSRSSSSSSVSLVNSTVSGNTSNRSGGGIHTLFSNVSLTNSTVTDNSALVAGGGIGLSANSSLVLLQNSIVAGNETNGTAPDLSTVGSATNNLIVENSLIGDTTGSGITFTTGTGNILNQPALLGPLADNGGATQTHALLSGSLAINAGSNAIAIAVGLTDQRGVGRIRAGTVDIGSFESDSNERNLIVTTSLDVVDPSDGFLSLREAIIIVNANAATDTITFDPSF